MKVNFKISNFIILLFIVVLLTDLFYTIKNNSSVSRQNLLNQVNQYYNHNISNILSDVSKLNQPIAEGHTNVIFLLDLLLRTKGSDDPLISDSRSVITFNENGNISDLAKTNVVEISEYRFGSSRNIPHFLLNNYLYRIGDNYLGEKVIYIDRWGFVTDSTLYKAKFNNSHLSVTTDKSDKGEK